MKRKEEEVIDKTMEFFSNSGHDTFKNEILSILSKDFTVWRILRLRLVCKVWSVTVLTIKHLSFTKYEKLKNCPLDQFSSLKSLCVVPYHMEDVSFSMPNITELIVQNDGYSDVRDLSLKLNCWTSLKKLCIYGLYSLMADDISELTELQSLHCYVKCFKKPEDIYLLKNLESLNIWGFPQSLTLVDKLPKLTYLSSCSPDHFMNYTGKGLLNTMHTNEVVVEDNIRSDFYYYSKAEDDIEAEGKWESGVFTGVVSFSLYNYKEKISKVIKGPMLNGKFHGQVYERDYRNRIGTTGNWSEGKREGTHIVYQWQDGSDSYTTLKYETWVNGVLHV